MPSIEDRVTIRMGDEEMLRCEGYTVEMGVMTQPARFAVRIGHSGVIASFLERYPPGSKFELYVSSSDDPTPRLQFSGYVDGHAAGGQSSTATFRGRDALARLADAHAVADKSYHGKTYLQLVKDVLKDAGYEDAEIADDTLDDTTAKTGSSRVKDVTTHRETGFKARVRKVVVHPPRIRAGQPYYGFLRQHLDRQGMFLYATADGAFVLMEPDPKLFPLYTIANVGKVDATAPGNVVDFDYSHDTTPRFSSCVVFGHGGGAALGRTLANGRFSDDEITNLGIVKPMCFVDANVSSDAEANFFAKRRIAETRRAGWQLRYTVAGHTTPSWTGGGRIVWTRNTMVTVDDDELNIHGPHYIESLALGGDSDRTWTTLRLMRPTDLVFGE